MNLQVRPSCMRGGESLRPKYQYYTKANLDKLRAAGYDKPMTRLEDSVRQYVQNFLNTEDPYL